MIIVLSPSTPRSCSFHAFFPFTIITSNASNTMKI